MNGFVLTACQRKGGVGRSTLLYNLAGALAKRGLRTLLVDLDPQASITQICLGPEIVDTLPVHRSIVSLLDDALFGTVQVDHPAGRDPRRGSRPRIERAVPVQSPRAREDRATPGLRSETRWPMSEATTTRSSATPRRAWRRCRGSRP